MSKLKPSTFLAASVIGLTLLLLLPISSIATSMSASPIIVRQQTDRDRLLAQQTRNPERENIQFDIDPDWKEGSMSEQPNVYKLTEFVREGDDIKSWHELLTIQNFSLKSKADSPEAMLNTLKNVREKECPGSTRWNVIQKDEKSILYEWQAKPCLGFPEQHEIARIIDGKYNRFLIRYTAKVYQLDSSSRAKWIERFSQAKILLIQVSSESIKFTWLQEHLKVSKETENQIREVIFKDDLKRVPACQTREVVKIDRAIPLLLEEGDDHRWLHHLEKWEIKRCNQSVQYLVWQTLDQIHDRERLMVGPLDGAQNALEKQPALKMLLQYKP